MKIGFIGLGNMASAMIGGILKNGICNPADIVGSDLSGAAIQAVKDAHGIRTVSNNVDVVSESDIIILSIKPQFYEVVIKEISGFVTKDQIIVTIAPGKTTGWILEKFGKTVKTVRCMPNTPALVLEGCTGVCKNEHVTDIEMEKVLKIIQSFGIARVVPENLMDVVVGVSGSSPAYVFMFIEAMADAAVADGMPRALAYEFAAQSVYGSAKMVLETKKHPGELKDMVCSPGGTTIQAVRVLEERGLRSAVMEAQMKCVEKSRSL